MLIVKSLHIVFMVTWFAGLFYLPRLFVYHTMADDRPSIERFKTMERKLRCRILTPEKTVYTGDVDMVVAPGLDGEAAETGGSPVGADENRTAELGVLDEGVGRIAVRHRVVLPQPGGVVMGKPRQLRPS